jgi:threonine/homoserine/homoserine lactone efflux protein
MSELAFLSAVLALLLAPGPTNTLMALAGAQAGFARVLRLLPVELLGYLTTILPLTWLGAPLLARWPVLATGLKVLAAAWVLWLALRLWRGTGEGAEAQVTARRVFVTTMLNPKALIFGLVLLPGFGQAGFAPRLALFCGMVSGVAVLWGLGGTLARAGAGAGAERMVLVQRLAASWLAVVAVMLIGGVVGG